MGSIARNGFQGSLLNTKKSVIGLNQPGAVINKEFVGKRDYASR